jgi:hypothetical protein
MSEWQRASGWRLCGGCGAVIAVGDPVLVIPVGHRGRLALLRCGGCRQAPPDLPAVIACSVQLAQPELVPVRRLAGLPLDWRTRQSGERDPGEEG